MLQFHPKTKSQTIEIETLE